MNLKFKSIVTHWEHELAGRIGEGKNKFKLSSSDSPRAVHAAFEIPDSLDCDREMVLNMLRNTGQKVTITIEIVETPIQKARRLLSDGKTKEAVAEALTILEGLTK